MSARCTAAKTGIHTSEVARADCPSCGAASRPRLAAAALPAPALAPLSASSGPRLDSPVSETRLDKDAIGDNFEYGLDGQDTLARRVAVFQVPGTPAAYLALEVDFEFQSDETFAAEFFDLDSVDHDPAYATYRLASFPCTDAADPYGSRVGDSTFLDRVAGDDVRVGSEWPAVERDLLAASQKSIKELATGDGPLASALRDVTSPHPVAI